MSLKDHGANAKQRWLFMHRNVLGVQTRDPPRHSPQQPAAPPERRALTKLLASPRMRRRLGWLATTLGFSGVIGLLIVLLPGRPDDGGAPLVEGAGDLPPRA